MISEERKFRSEIMKLAGIAFLTPLGKIILDPINTFSIFGLPKFIGFVIYSFILTFVGISIINRAYDIIDIES